MPRSVTPPSARKRGTFMNFNHEEFMLMMLYNTGIRLGLNVFNALFIGVLGVPGFGLLLLLQWVLT